MSVLVVGGAGYIGSHAVRALQQDGQDVVVLDNLQTDIAPPYQKVSPYTWGICATGRSSKGSSIVRQSRTSSTSPPIHSSENR